MAVRKLGPPRVAVLGGGVSGLTLAWYLRARARDALAAARALAGTRGTSAAAAHPGGGGGGGRDALRELLDLEVVVVERAPRLGGWVQSVDGGPSSGNGGGGGGDGASPGSRGHVFERGPRGFRPSGTGLQTLRLVEALGLADAAVRPEDAAKHRFLYVDGALQKMPAGLADLARMPPVLRESLRGIVGEPFRPRGLWADESIHDFVSRRFSPHVAEKLVGAMVSGIYAGDPKELSVRSCLPRLWDWELDAGSVLKGAFGVGGAKNSRGGGVGGAGAARRVDVVHDDDSEFVRTFSKASQVSFQHGMEQLTRTLADALDRDPAVRIVTGQGAAEIGTGAEGAGGALSTPQGMYVSLDDGETLECDHVFSTLPAPALRAALQRGRSGPGAGGDDGLDTVCDLLGDIHAVDVGVVNLAFEGPEDPIKREGFGYLIPSSEGERILGVSFDSCIFPGQSVPGRGAPDGTNGSSDNKVVETRVCVMIGGVHGRDVASMDESALLDEARSALSRQLGMSDAALATEVSSCAGVMRECIPQYRVGHGELVRQVELELQREMPGLTVLGTPFYGVGIADCVARAEATAHEFRLA